MHSAALLVLNCQIVPVDEKLIMMGNSYIIALWGVAYSDVWHSCTLGIQSF